MKKTVFALFGLCVIWMSIVFSIRTWAFNPNFYTRQYETMDLSQQLHVSSNDLNRSIACLLDYLEDRREDIQLTIEKDNIEQSAYNQRETDHMVDVKTLYQRVKLSSLIASLYVIFVLVFFGKDKKKLVGNISLGIMEASFAFIVFIVFLGMWMAIDFTDFWTRFHHIFFTNDLWLLTPGVDFMIDILPEIVFFKLVRAIVLTSVAIILILNGLSFILYRKIRKEE